MFGLPRVRHFILLEYCQYKQTFCLLNYSKYGYSVLVYKYMFRICGPVYRRNSPSKLKYMLYIQAASWRRAKEIYSYMPTAHFISIVLVSKWLHLVRIALKSLFNSNSHLEFDILSDFNQPYF